MDLQRIRLRNVRQRDLAHFFQQQRDRDARHMAAFTSADGDDEQAFLSHWRRILSDPTVLMKTIQLDGGDVAGSIGSYVDAELGAPEVTYWVGKDHWGRGIASRALGLFLAHQRERPLYARVATDNVRSLRVLEKHDFRVSREEVGFAPARGEPVAEYVLRLDAHH